MLFFFFLHLMLFSQSKMFLRTTVHISLFLNVFFQMRKYLKMKVIACKCNCLRIFLKIMIILPTNSTWAIKNLTLTQMTFKLLPVIITVISQVMISSNLMIIRETANDEALFDRFYTYIRYWHCWSWDRCAFAIPSLTQWFRYTYSRIWM